MNPRGSHQPRRDVRPPPDVSPGVSALAAFPWVSSRILRFTARGEYPLAFPPECPLLMQFLQFSVDHQVSLSYHDYLEFALICEGTGRFTAESRSYSVAPGDLMIIGGREFHRLEADRDDVMKVVSAHFRQELVHAPGDSPLNFEYLKPFLYRGAQFSHRIARADLPEGFVLDRIGWIQREVQAGKPDYPLAVKTYLADILFVVSRHCGQTCGELAPPDRHAQDFERLLEVFSYVRKNCHEPLSLRQLARLAHMTPSYFCRFFKAQTGSTLTEYLLRLRIDLAMDFLSNSAMSVTDIAYASGFSSHSYFDRVFKRLKGMTPLEYRRHPKV